MTKRTEGPWVLAEDVFNYRPEIRDRDGRLIAVVMAHYPMSATTQSANAAFIITACNCHDELVEALKMLIGFIPDGWGMPLGYSHVVAQAEQAIAKAEGVKEADHDRR